VSSGEGEHGTDAHPASELLGVAVADEAADIWAAEGLAGEPEVEDHGDGVFEVVPLGGVVACPCCGVAMAADEVGACEDERAFVGIGALDADLRALCHEHAVDVVVSGVCAGREVAAAGVEVVFGHGLGGDVEDGWLVHVVPDAVDAVCHEVHIEAGPPLHGLGSRVVGEDALSGPDLAVVDRAVGSLDPVVSCLALVKDAVSGLGLDAGVDHPDRVVAHGVEVAVERFGIGEVVGVEGEDAVSVHVVDIKPDDVAGDVAIAEAVGDLPDAGLWVVGIAALVVSDGPEGGEFDGADVGGELCQDLLGRGTFDDDDGECGADGGEADSVGQIDLAAVGGVGQKAEGGAVFADAQDPRVGLIERGGVLSIPVGIGVPGLDDATVAEERAGVLAGAVETDVPVDGDGRGLAAAGVGAERDAEVVCCGCVRGELLTDCGVHERHGGVRGGSCLFRGVPADRSQGECAGDLREGCAGVERERKARERAEHAALGERHNCDTSKRGEPRRHGCVFGRNSVATVRGLVRA
jgi:hypothetical protein